MSEHFPSEESSSSQNQEISKNASLENVQIGGIAGRDLDVIQIQVTVHIPYRDNLVTDGGISSSSNSDVVNWTDQKRRYRTFLLESVKHIWIEANEQSLHRQALIELSLKKQKLAVQSPLVAFRSLLVNL